MKTLRFLLSLFWATAPAISATRTWDGGGTFERWESGINWTGNDPPNPGDDLVFPANGGSGYETDNNFPAGTSFRSITCTNLHFFPALGWEHDGNLVLLGSGGLNIKGPLGGDAAAVFKLPIIVGANQTWTIARFVMRNGGTLELNGRTLTITNEPPEIGATNTKAEIQLEESITGGGSLNFTAAKVTGGPSPIPGIPALVVFRPLEVELHAANTFTASAAVGHSVTVTTLHPAAFGSTAGVTTVNGQVHFRSSGTVSEPFQINSGALVAKVPGVTMAGPAVIAGSAVIGTGDGATGIFAIHSGPISGSGQLHVQGAGTLRLSGIAPVTMDGEMVVAAQGGDVMNLELDKTSAAAVGGDLTVSAGGRVKWLRASQMNNGAELTLRQDGEAHLNGKAETITTLVVDGGLLFTEGAALGVRGDIISNAKGPGGPEVTGTLRMDGTSAPHIFEVADSSPDFVFDFSLLGDVIAGSGFGTHVVRKTGNGMMQWAGNSTIGRLEAAAGLMRYNGTSPAMDVLMDGGTFTGLGSIRDLSVGTTTGHYDQSAFPLTVRNLTLNGGGSSLRLGSSIGGGDPRLIATGTVTLGNAVLIASSSFVVGGGIGTESTIIQKNSAGPVNGTFGNLPEGSLITMTGRTFRLSYAGGDGNDVTLTLVSVPATGVTRTWTGNGGSNNMSVAGNWNPSGTPQAGDAVVFPDSPRKTLNNDLGQYFPLASLRFTSPDYHLTGNALGVSQNITADFTTGAVQVNTPLRLSGNVTLSALSTGRLRLGTIDVFSLDLNGFSLTFHAVTFAGAAGAQKPTVYIGDDAFAFQPFTGITGAGSVTKTGAGFAAVQCFCDYTGPTTVGAGTFAASTGDSLGAGGPGNHTTVNAGAILAITQTATADEFHDDFYVSGTVRALDFDTGGGVAEVLGTFICSGTAVVDVPLFAQLYLRGPITGGTLQKTGPEFLSIGSSFLAVPDNAVPNTFSMLEVTGGDVQLQKDDGVTAARFVKVTDGRLYLDSHEQISERVWLAADSAIFDLNGYHETLNRLDVTGGAVQGSGVSNLIVSEINGGGTATASTIGVPVTLPAGIPGGLATLGVSDGTAVEDLMFTAPVSGAAGMGFFKTGAGRVRFNSTLLPPIQVFTGTAAVMGGGAAPVTLTGGTLTGTGPVGFITGAGRVEPGASPGILKCASLTWNAGTTFAPEIQTTTAGAGYDQLDVAGTVTLGGATLETTVISGFTAVSGTVLTVIKNDGTDAVSGTFAGLPENTVFSTSGKAFRISYIGGTGNDVTLTTITQGTGVTRVWDGETSTGWTTATNWVNLPGSSASAPSAGDDLVFPAGAQRISNANNFPAGTVFNSITIQAPGYILGGNAIQLNAGCAFENTSGQSQLQVAVTLTQPQTFSAAAGGQGLLGTTLGITNGGFTLTVDAAAGGAILLNGLTGTGNVVKTGPGFLSFGTSNAHTGTLTAGAGQVNVTQLAGLGSGAAGITVAQGATLGFNSNSTGTLTKPITLGGRLTFSSSPIILAGAISLPSGNDGILEAFGTTGPTISGAVSGSGRLEKRGAAALILGGAAANTFTGGTWVSAGTLQVQKSSGLVALPGPVTIGDGTGADILLFAAANQIGNSAAVSLHGSGAALQCASFNDAIGALRMTGGSVTGTGTLSITGITSFASATTAAIEVNLNPGSAECAVNAEDGDAAVDLQISGEWNGGAALNVIRTGEGTVMFAGGGTADTLQLTAGLTRIERDWSGVDIALKGGTLGGSGGTGPVAADERGGGVAPGSSPGILTTGNLTANERTSFTFEIGGTVAGTGHDQIDVTGTVDPANAAMNIVWLPGFTPMTGQSFMLIQNDGSDDILTEFSGMSEGREITLGPVTAVVSYKGGDRNDVALTVVRLNDTRTLRVWDGGGADNKWTTDANWAGDVAPQQGDSLEFPAGAAQLTSVNDYPAGMNFHHVDFTGPGYLVTGAAVFLNTGVSGDFSSGISQWGLPVTFTQPQTMSMAGTGQVQFTTAATVNNAGHALTVETETLSIFVFLGVISGGGGILKTGPGVLALQAANAFTGVTSVSQGVVNVSKNTSLGGGAIIQSGGSVGLTSGDPLVVATPMTLLGRLTSIGNNHRLNGVITIPAGAAAEFSVASNRLDAAGRIQGAGSLRKNGPGVLGLIGTVSNTFAGGFFNGQGDVILGKTAGIAALPGHVSNGDGFAATPARRLILAANNQIADTAVVRISGETSLLDLAGFSDTFTSLEMTGGTAATGGGTLTLTGNAASFSAASPAVISGRLVLSGTGSRDWTVADGGADPDLLISSALAAPSGAVLHKLGAGTCGFAGTGLDAATVKADAGSLVFMGNQPLLDTVLDGGAALGTGTCGAINVLAGGGVVSPGLSPGILHAKSLLANSSTSLRFELNGIAAGTEYDQLQTTASNALGNATLDLVLGFEPAAGSSFMLIENTNAAATLTGTFAGLPQNGHLSAPGGKVFRINYSGGDGNDVVITVVDVPAPEFTSFTVVPGTGGEAGLDVANISAVGVEGVTYVLETSSNLSDWTARQTVTAGPGGTISFRVTQSAAEARQYCRARLL